LEVEGSQRSQTAFQAAPGMYKNGAKRWFPALLDLKIAKNAVSLLKNK
jgi:hypothetical protein